MAGGERSGAGLAASVQAQLNAWGERMDRGFAKIEEMLTGIDDRVRRLENNEAGCQPLVNSRLDAAIRRIDGHDEAIKTLTQANVDLGKAILELQQSNKILKWIGGVLGGTVALWVINQLLGLIK